MPPSRSLSVHRRRRRATLAGLLLVALGVAACGNKGDLYLPESPVDDQQLRSIDEALDGLDDEVGGANEDAGASGKAGATRRPRGAGVGAGLRTVPSARGQHR